MGRGYVLGFDVGGSGGRCLLLEPGGATHGAWRPWCHPVAPGSGGFGYDLDLERLWSELSALAREVLARAGAAPGDVAGVAASGMRHTTVVLDRDGKARLAVPNRDARGASEILALAAEHGAALHAQTGHWPAPIFTAARLLWLQARAPEALTPGASVLSLNDWVAWRLCGERASDPSQAGATGLFDLERRDWAWDWIERVGLPRSLFPEMREPGERLGALHAAGARDWGLAPGIPVAVGGADTQCGLLGADVLEPGQLGAITGSTAPLQLVTDRPRVDPEARLWTGQHVIPKRWVLESNAGPMGEALAWFAQVLYPDAPEPVGSLLADAAEADPGAAGMLTTPGSSVMNARELAVPVATLSFSHLTTTAGRPRAQLARSAVEGMAFALRANHEQICAIVGTEAAASPMRLGGGLARSETWAQLLADVLDRPVETNATADSTALGAAFAAACAAGWATDLPSAARALAGPRRLHTPDPERAGLYAGLYRSWDELRAVRAEADALATRLTLPIVLRTPPAAPPRAPARFRPRILATSDLDPESVARLARLGELEHASFREAMRLLAGPSLCEALAGVHVFVTEVDVVDAAALAALPELRVVAACRGDAVNVDLEACTAHGIPVLHAPGRNADAVADLTLAFLLGLARRLPRAIAFLREPGGRAGDMARMGRAFSELRGRELWRKCVGLVGFGAVGRAVARRLHGFEARVLVYDPFVAPEALTRLGAEAVSLDVLLERSDFVSLHAAVGESSRGLLGAAELARMKPGACLVNTARAALVDETALAQALAAGALGGAALDVFAVEPPGPDHPLLQRDDVIATPHVGGNTEDVAAHQGASVADDLERLLRGEPPLHVRNPEVLADFDWERPRPRPSAEVLARLGARPAPAVSDLERAPPAAPPPPARPATKDVPSAVHARMQALLQGFVERCTNDARLREAAAQRDVTLHFALGDLPLEFHLRLRRGALSGALGAPAEAAEVELRMPADVLDGMFTGRVNPMQAAMDGRLGFSGDTAKAMTLQQIQPDLSRLYAEARAEVGDPGDLAALSEPADASGAAAPVAEDALREQLVEVVRELYAQQLITATGGNVSVRIPGTDALWITPSQLFKGDLRPEILVRIGLDGRSLDPRAASPSSERLMHCAVYRRRPEAQAVVHAHAAHATILVDADLPFLPTSTEAAFFDELPRVPFVMPGTEELADAVGEAIAGSWAVLMRNHGLLVAGRSLRRAADMVEIIERSAQIQIGCRALGVEPPVLPADVVHSLRALGDLVA